MLKTPQKIIMYRFSRDKHDIVSLFVFVKRSMYISNIIISYLSILHFFSFSFSESRCNVFWVCEFISADHMDRVSIPDGDVCPSCPARTHDAVKPLLFHQGPASRAVTWTAADGAVLTLAPLRLQSVKQIIRAKIADSILLGLKKVINSLRLSNRHIDMASQNNSL